MATSIELKSRLQKFLADPKADNEFRYWFASLLTQQNDPGLEALAHAIDSAFSDAAEGLYTPLELRAYLADLAQEEKGRQINVADLTIVTWDSGFFSSAPHQYNYVSASGAFYRPDATSPSTLSAGMEQPTFWETLVAPAPAPAILAGPALSSEAQ